MERILSIKTLSDRAWKLIYAQFNKANLEMFLDETENVMILEYFLGLAIFY